MKLLVCFGTRPEAIKMCTLVIELKKQGFEVFVCVTAQHREMLDQVLDFFEIKPEFDLNLMKQNQSLNQISANIFNAIDDVLTKVNPDLVFVHGDTTTSSIVAWASFHRNIKIAHIEAGLRTFNLKNPFPEELNRQITSKIADFHFAPTLLAQQNLLNENINPKNVLITGNTVIDSLLWTLNKLENNYSNAAIENLKKDIDFSKKIILVTSHRRENFGNSFENICKSLILISKIPNVQIIFPLHLNPNINAPARQYLSNIANIKLINPLDYPSFVWIMKKSYLILTDSGGVQEEAPSLGIPVLVLRETTERPEAVEVGTVKMVGSDIKKILNSVKKLIEDKSFYLEMSKLHNPYGNGDAIQKIIEFIKTNCQ